MEVGLSINAAPTPPSFSGNTSIQANIVPLNPGSTANFQKSQIVWPRESAEHIETLWIRVIRLGIGRRPVQRFPGLHAQTLAPTTP